MPLITVELKFRKDAPTYVEGVDSKGYPRAFEKATHTYRIDTDKLIVEVDQRAWERRLARKPVIKPAKIAARKRTERNCLLCKHPFKAEPQMRICGPCKKTANWQTGADCICHI